jgi:hypothetical protein
LPVCFVGFLSALQLLGAELWGLLRMLWIIQPAPAELGEDIGASAAFEAVDRQAALAVTQPEFAVILANDALAVPPAIVGLVASERASNRLSAHSRRSRCVA